MMNRTWWTSQTLPEHTGIGWAIWDKKVTVCAGLGDVEAHLLRWDPLHPVLVGPPGKTSFSVPTAIDETAARTSQSFLVRARIGMAMLFAFAMVTLLVGFIKPHPALPSIAGLVGALACAATFDYVKFLRNDQKLTQRALFFHWIRVSSSIRLGLVTWVAMLLALAAFQFGYDFTYGVDAALHRFGLLFEEFEGGEHWRLLTGPYIHTGFAHYASNALCLLFVGPVLFAALGLRSFGIFAIANAAAGYIQFLVAPIHFNAYCGVSAGLFALYGTLLTASAINPKLLPAGMREMCFFIVGISLAGTASLSQSSANVAHVAGLLIGIGSGFLCSGSFQTLTRDNHLE